MANHSLHNVDTSIYYLHFSTIRFIRYANEMATDVGEIENIVNYGISPGIQHYHNISSGGRSGYHPEADMLGNVSEDSTFQLPPKRLRARTPLKDRADRNANVSGAASQAVARLSQVDLALGRSPSSPVDEQRADAVFDDQLAFDDLLEARVSFGGLKSPKSRPKQDYVVIQ